MSKSPDKILVGFAGEPNGKITLVDLRQPEGHTHKVIREAGNYAWAEVSVGDIVFPAGTWTDALKVSGCINLKVFAGTVEGGTEDVLDVNHSDNCQIYIKDAHPRGNFVTTQKGASKKILVHIDRQHGHGKEVDHDYGNNSDQGNGQTTACSLFAKEVNGSTIKVRVLRGTPPNLAGGPFKWAFPSPYAWYHRICIWFLNLVQ